MKTVTRYRDGETGEIAARGPLLMCGYFNADAENQFRTRTKGWYRTRDLGRRNPDGSITFVGPKMTMIKSGLENVYPAEVEACIRTHPAVAEVCVIGVPDPKWAQNVKAIVVLRKGAQITAEHIVDHCRSSIASYRKPKIVEFCTSLPKLPTGAIDRSGVDSAWGGGGYPKAG
jgi:acyl-CoA synthetase (AMP-forming)/AMP-acid ligase II